MHFADIWEAVAQVIPDHSAVVQGDRRVSWGHYEQRAARLAGGLRRLGLGPDHTVGLYMYNCPEYLEAQFAALKVRAIPVNVNYRYLDDELAYLLDNADIEVLVYHASLGERLQRVRSRLTRLRTLIEVDDTEDSALVVNDAVPYERMLASHDPDEPRPRSAADLYMLYTGGTTGMPKGVMYRVGDVARSFLAATPPLLGLPPIEDAAGVGRAVAVLEAEGRLLVSVPGPPLMHGTGVWIGAMAPHCLGSTVALLAERSFNADAMIDLMEAERAGLLVIVGDAFARPLVSALDVRAARSRPADLGSLKIVASSGAMFSAEVKQRFLEHVPSALILDLLGSSEGGMGGAVTSATSPPATARFQLNPGVRVLLQDERDVIPGSGEIGQVALTGAMVPIGYYKDPEKSARTFREIDGVRYSLPGDMATVESDGSIHLLGRGSSCINTGGEKVFPEEVEEAIKTHDAVDDCLVFGIDDERFGQAVAAVVALDPSVTPAPAGDDLVAYARTKLAGYKAPRHVRVVELVPRAANGKADYRAARTLMQPPQQETRSSEDRTPLSEASPSSSD